MVNELHPVPRAPAPWTMRAESYLLLLRLKELPEGLYDGLEEAWQDEGLGRFEGGLGAVMIVRYADTPVGRLCLVLCACKCLAFPQSVYGVQLSQFYAFLNPFTMSLLTQSKVMVRCTSGVTKCPC